MIHVRAVAANRNLPNVIEHQREFLIAYTQIGHLVNSFQLFQFSPSRFVSACTSFSRVPFSSSKLRDGFSFSRKLALVFARAVIYFAFVFACFERACSD